jgi:hypothetical protein
MKILANPRRADGKWCDVVARPEGSCAWVYSVPGALVCEVDWIPVWRLNVPTDFLRYTRGAIFPDLAAIGQGADDHGYVVTVRGVEPVGLAPGQNPVAFGRDGTRYIMQANGRSYKQGSTIVTVPLTSQGIRDVLPNGTVIMGDESLHKVIKGHNFHQYQTRGEITVGQAGTDIGIGVLYKDDYLVIPRPGDPQGVHVADLHDGRIAVCAWTVHGAELWLIDLHAAAEPAPKPDPIPDPKPDPKPEPEPMSTHRYDGGGNDTNTCDQCGQSRFAVVHRVPEGLVPHRYDGGEQDTGLCDLCQQGRVSDLHDPIGPVVPEDRPSPGTTPDHARVIVALAAEFPHLLASGRNTRAHVGEFTERAALRLHAIDPDWGLLSKSPGENQWNGHGVDSLIYKATQQVVDILSSAGAADDHERTPEQRNEAARPTWIHQPKRPNNNWMAPVPVGGSPAPENDDPPPLPPPSNLPTLHQWIKVEYPQLVAVYKSRHGGNEPDHEWAAFQTCRRGGVMLAPGEPAWSFERMLEHERNA